MVIYEVNLDINNEIFENFKVWLFAHVKEMVQFKGFLEAKILLENNEIKESQKITCCYLLDSQENLDNYLKNHAPAMRQDGINKFGNKFSATRRILKVIETIIPSASKINMSNIIQKETAGLL